MKEIRRRITERRCRAVPRVARFARVTLAVNRVRVNVVLGDVLLGLFLAWREWLPREMQPSRVAVAGGLHAPHHDRPLVRIRCAVS